MKAQIYSVRVVHRSTMTRRRYSILVPGIDDFIKSQEAMLALIPDGFRIESVEAQDTDALAFVLSVSEEW